MNIEKLEKLVGMYKRFLLSEKLIGQGDSVEYVTKLLDGLVAYCRVHNALFEKGE